MNNRKLFEIREIKGKHIMLGLLGLLVLAGALAIYKCLQNNNFINKFHKDENGDPITKYMPMDEDNKGLYGKVNYYLEMARSQGDTVTAISGKNLNRLFPALMFSYSSDTASVSYLVSPEEVRLVGFNVDSIKTLSAAARDTMINFYNNSIFKSLIEERQRINLSRKYFIITWSKDKKHIESIKIDPTLGDVPLLSDNWKGEILLDDPFSKIDTNVVYLIKDNIPLPLFSSNRSSQDFESYRNRNNIQSYKTIKFEDWAKYSVSEFETIYGELNNSDSTRSKSIKIDFENQQYITFLNRDGILRIQWNAIEINILKDGKKIEIKEEQKDDFPINDFKNVIQLQINTGDKNIHIISVVRKPFNKGSVMVDNFLRINMSEQLTDLAVKQQFANIANNLSDKDNIRQLHLTSNPFLSKYLENEMKKYYENTLKSKAVDENQADEFQISVCLMDIATGEIIATPFYSNRMKDMNLDIVAEVPNYNFTNHDFGSAFKPLLAFAVVKRFPSLKDFNFLIGNDYSKDFLQNKEGKNLGAQMLGYKTEYYGPESHGGDMYSAFWDTCSNRKTFLAKSHDNYPIALTMLALQEEGDGAYNLLQGGNLNNENNKKLNQLALLNNYQTSSRIAYNPNDVNRKAHFNGKDLDKSEFARLLEKLYDVNAGRRISIGMTYSDTLFWKNLKNKKIEKKLQGFAPNAVFMQLNLTTDFRSFERFVIGQGNNQWNNVKLAEAYSRLLSKKKVRATWIKNTDTVVDWLDDADSVVWSDFMTDWREAVKNSPKLLTPAYKKLKDTIPNFDSTYYFYCKTGTPKENNEMDNIFINGKTMKMYRDEGIFCFGITNQDINNPRGIVGIVYIKHLSENKPGTGVESSTARDFLTSKIFKKIMFYNKNRFQ